MSGARPWRAPSVGPGPAATSGEALAAEYRLSLLAAVATCALAPAYNIRWHVGPYPTTLLEVAILVSVALFLLETRQQRRRLEWRTPFSIPAILFVVAGAISVVVAPDRRAALGLYRAYELEPIAFFFVLAHVARSWRRASMVLAGLGLAGMVVAIPNAFVVIQAIRHHTLNVAVAPPVAIYMSANSLALFLVPLIAVAAVLVAYSRVPIERTAAGVFLVTAVPALLLSFSRGGYLALTAILVALALTHRRRIWLLFGTLAAGAATTRIPPIAARISHELNMQDPNNSLEERFRLWAATLRMLRDHPVFGSGLSGFKQTIAPYRLGQYTEDLIYPHNILLNFWTETGLLGVVAFGWLLAQALRVAIRAWREAASEWRPFQLGVLLALIGVVIHGLVDVPYWKNDLSLEFWALLGLSWAGSAGFSARRGTRIG